MPRMDFCNWLDQMIRRKQDFTNHILFTDESTFDRNGIINSHNMHYWSEENPHLIKKTKHQIKFSLNVWCGILGGHLIGPVFLPSRLTGNDYLEFLASTLPELLGNIPLASLRNMFFMHDGAPAHFSRAVREYLNGRFREKWIGRGGPIQWPARSPDLNPLDFFFGVT